MDLFVSFCKNKRTECQQCYTYFLPLPISPSCCTALLKSLIIGPVLHYNMRGPHASCPLLMHLMSEITLLPTMTLRQQDVFSMQLSLCLVASTLLAKQGSHKSLLIDLLLSLLTAVEHSYIRHGASVLLIDRFRIP